MKTHIKVFSIILLGIIVSGNFSYSQFKEDAYRLSYLGLGFGARSLGLGTAFIGVANDFSAVYWNPAGLGRIRLNEISGGFSHLSYDNESSLLGDEQSFSNSGTNINSAGIVYPFPVTRGSLVFAIGYGRQTDFTSALGFKGFNNVSSIVEYPDSVELQGKILEGGGMNNWIVAGAVEAVKGLFIGLSLNFISGTYTYTRDYNENDIYNRYYIKGWNQKITIDEDIGGFTARAGLLYEFRKHNARLGFNIKFPSYLSLKENYTDDWTLLSDPDISPVDTLYPYDSYPEYDVVSPFVFSAGVSWTLGQLMLSGAFDYTDWSQMEFRNVSDPAILDENTVIKDSLTATLNLRFGAELSIPNTDLQLRAGFIYLPSPYKSDSSPNDQKFITGGLGWIVEDAIRFDFGYAYGFWDTQHAVVYANPSEKIRTHNVIASISYRF